ncbi:DUF2309 domain-containing protein [Balneolaceae bacterium YR4-1]|uniref:Probable inorganic carbon transporter subunit DabA n=1 Tax=Halalkalibaculum roseum TaxID=2709311 RepID=A0A6M1SQT1_9BACT|nr:DUF2309 domain-containing protein [Halalkalibaculum roseum]NGP75072.1 DUF2309 domain-containing protein [Halalkalibaculum roseum]
MKYQRIQSHIEELSEQLVKNWPLYSFVTSNPLSGLEELHFEDAVTQLRNYISIEGYPSTSVFRQALLEDEINHKLIENHLLQKGITLSVEESLERMKLLEEQNEKEKVLGDVDRHLIKWLTVFMDQGSTEWNMPNREAGFYKAWREIASYDTSLPNREMLNALPKDSYAAIQEILSANDPENQREILKHHLMALPGWTGYIAYREENEHDWQKVSPVTLTDYLAVRLALYALFGQDIKHDGDTKNNKQQNEEDILKGAWLKAMEQTYQEKLFQKVSAGNKNGQSDTEESPEAQMVFCIDTRSERIRRAVEQAGPYQTFGYAGFFGIAMDYKHPEKNITNKSCPPIVNSAYLATEVTDESRTGKMETFDYYNNLRKALLRFRFTLKNNIPASFGYVESAGFFYGLALLLKTLVPDLVHRFFERITNYTGKPEWFSEVTLTHNEHEGNNAEQHLSTAERAGIAKAAFEAMGWQHFAPIVVWAGHGSETANNPFGSSLDCGACAGNKGRHNARVMARICNDTDVRNLLAAEYDIQIPDETWFVAAEHNTTTNHIELYDQQVPARFRQQVDELKKNLATAQVYANKEQFDIPAADAELTAREAARRASDWAETRPEWGLAGNASFIIGPRKLTSNLNLEARSFLHSYNWEKDPSGDQLTAILQGPMVVTQWINNHYYFSSVDNDHFGGGSKVTQNVTGKYGVVQGNGGDLRCGLPQESLQVDDSRQQHIPLRLTVLIQAPKERVESIIQKHNDTLGRLVQNEWIYLAVMDPQEGNTITSLNKIQRQQEEVESESMAIY